MKNICERLKFSSLTHTQINKYIYIYIYIYIYSIFNNINRIKFSSYKLAPKIKRYLWTNYELNDKLFFF